MRYFSVGSNWCSCSHDLKTSACCQTAMASSSDACSVSSDDCLDESDDAECSLSPMTQPLLTHPALQYQFRELLDSFHAAWLELLMALSARSAAYDIDHPRQENREQQLNANTELPPDEEWTPRFQARLYSVVLTKTKPIYQIYIADVPKHLRYDTMPQTPRCDMRSMSTRKWRYDLKMWNQNLKQWYEERHQDRKAFATTNTTGG